MLALNRIMSRGSLAALIAAALIAAPALADKQAEQDADRPGPFEGPTPPSTTVVQLSKLATTGPTPEPINPVPESAEITAAVERGVQFLLDDQMASGCWGSAQRTKGLNIYAPPPGAHHAFRMGVTSLVLMALVEVEPHLDGELKSQVGEAIERGADWLDERLGRLRRATPDALYNVWGHAYAIQALVRLHDRAEGDPERQAHFKELAEGQADYLERYSFVGGGWSYYDFLAGTQTPGDAAFSFCTATVLIALHEAKSIGIDFPQRLIDKAITSIHRQQKSDFSYAYGEYLRMRPMYSINRPAGSLGRSQVCNLALRLYGDPRVTDEVMMTWLNRLFARNGWLDIGRKRPIPHETHFAISGYFYYYAHLYAAMCIEELPADERPYFQQHLAHVLLPLQESDGSWWDYPLYNYHQQYGTAMAIMALLRCQQDTDIDGAPLLAAEQGAPDTDVD